MTSLPLDPKVDLSKVTTLAATLKSHAGADLVIDASEVTQVGALCLQTLAAAAQSWRASGHSLTISPRSEAFDESLLVFGLDLDDLQSTEAA
ncbi:hypothetical protein BFP70_14210 [Thioclava sp. SK-1]|uniref:STAS domain-containing protein n=1 Tax=Thioclava sp. SK-1 TaxID=1889770 RepID=UPI000824993A|nr:STAS domain-containing protein [Thioclava sp. SK-1]OCX62318.1 hypothetical protein BFP70_14210 [Thioclava sp. SK-1]